MVYKSFDRHTKKVNSIVMEFTFFFAVRTGLGPVTSSVTGWHSNQLN